MTLRLPYYCGCETELEPGSLVSIDMALRRGLALARPVAEVERGRHPAHLN